jgi:hypothetical protein
MLAPKLGDGSSRHTTVSRYVTRCCQHAGPTSAPLYAPRRLGSHPTAFDASPPFVAAPRLNEEAHLRGAGLLGVRAGRQLRQRRVSLDTVTAAFGSSDVETPYARLAAALVGVVDAKELFEALEFFERVRRRLACDVIVDACAGHGLVGLLFAAFCKPVSAVTLLDLRRPPSFEAVHAAVCDVAPWVRDKHITYLEKDVRQLAEPVNAAAAADARLALRRMLLPHVPPATQLSTARVALTAVHACGTLTDACLALASAADVDAMAALPCCFTGTAANVPYGVRRLLGVSAAADVRRAFLLEEGGRYAVDFSSVPLAVTPVNRILVAVKRRGGVS